MRGFDDKARLAHLQELADEVLKEARAQGASAAEVGAHSDIGLSATVRLGEPETVEHTRDNSLGITVYFGQRKGSASTSDLSSSAIRESVRAACDIARYTAEDEFAGLADPALLATEFPDLDLYQSSPSMRPLPSARSAKQQRSPWMRVSAIPREQP